MDNSTTMVISSIYRQLLSKLLSNYDLHTSNKRNDHSSN